MIGDGDKPSSGPWTSNIQGKVFGLAPNGKRHVVAQVYRHADVPLVENALELRETLKALRDWCDANFNGVPDGYAQIMDRADIVLMNTGGSHGEH